MSRVLFSGNNQITQSFNAHKNNVSKGRGWAIGVDVVKHRNQLDYIVAHSAGTVIKVVDYLDGTNKVLDKEQMGYGNYVMILHNNNVVTLYAHLEKVSVKQGQKITKEQKIAFMGNTGNSSGAHLHFEVRQYKSAPTDATLHDNTKFEFLNSEKYLDADLPSNSTTTKAVGFLDTVTYKNNVLSCTGWAYKDKGEQIVTIKLIESGKEVKKFDIIANKSRPDVKSAMNYATDRVGFSGSVDTVTLKDGLYQVRAYVGRDVLSNSFMVEVKKELTAASYPDYSSGKSYKVMTRPNNWNTSKGTYRVFANAYNVWLTVKSSGYHLYDNNWNKLD